MRKFRKLLQDNAAFTLIELLVVIAVLGILAGIAVPRITGVQDEAKKSSVNSTASVIRNSLEQFYALEGSYPSQGAISSVSDINTALQSGDTDLSIDISTDGVSLNGSNNIDSDNYSITIQPTNDSTITATISDGGISKAE